jgi:hypothetical protein
LLLDKLRTEVLSYVHDVPTSASQAEMATRYGEYFPAYIKAGIKAELLDPDLGRFDLARLGAALKPERDLSFQLLGLQTLYDRYFLHVRGTRIELPQAFFMRVAMGLATREIDREARAIEFYDLLSSFDFMASTPTLFNSGTLRPQLSSCFLTAGSATTGPGCAGLARTSRAPMARARAWSRSSKSPTTPRSRSTRAESARARSARIWRPGTSTSRNFWT